MIRLIKKLQMALVLFLCASILLITEVNAEASIDNLREKGQECIDWHSSPEINGRVSVKGCLVSCAHLAAMAEKNPSILTTDRISRCEEEHSKVKSLISGEEPVVKLEDTRKQPPSTIEEMISDMKKREQECKTRLDNAKTKIEKRRAEGCYSMCYRGAIKVKLEGMPIKQAQEDWKMCVGFNFDR